MGQICKISLFSFMAIIVQIFQNFLTKEKTLGKYRFILCLIVNFQKVFSVEGLRSWLSLLAWKEKSFHVNVYQWWESKLWRSIPFFLKHSYNLNNYFKTYSIKNLILALLFLYLEFDCQFHVNWYNTWHLNRSYCCYIGTIMVMLEKLKVLGIH